MADASFVAGNPAITGHLPYDRLPRQALDEMPDAVKAVWRRRYLTDPEAELPVLGLLRRAEATLRSGGTSVTIRTLWIALADRAARSEDADLCAAAGLAGMAMGLQPS